MFKTQVEPRAAGEWFTANQRAGILTVIVRSIIHLEDVCL